MNCRRNYVINTNEISMHIYVIKMSKSRETERVKRRVIEGEIEKILYILVGCRLAKI